MFPAAKLILIWEVTTGYFASVYAATWKEAFAQLRTFLDRHKSRGKKGIKNLDHLQVLQLYMALGGIPYYWSFVQKEIK